MNKLKTALLILSAIVIVILIFFLVKNVNNANKKVDNDKIVSEIKYMDNRLTSLLNSVNNISLENHKVSDYLVPYTSSRMYCNVFILLFSLQF